MSSTSPKRGHPPGGMGGPLVTVQAERYYSAMIGLRPRGIRRFLALVLLLCFSLYGLEAEATDVHELEAQAHQTDHPTQPDGQPLHVCHCAHTHLVALASPPTLDLLVRPLPAPTWRVPASLPSTHPVPRLRPPIA